MHSVDVQRVSTAWWKTCSAVSGWWDRDAVQRSPVCTSTSYTDLRTNLDVTTVCWRLVVFGNDAPENNCIFCSTLHGYATRSSFKHQLSPSYAGDQKCHTKRRYALPYITRSLAKLYRSETGRQLSTTVRDPSIR